MQSLSNKQTKQTAHSFYVDLLFLSLVIGSLFFLFLGSRPLFVPDEGRYAEIAREMLVSGNYTTPTLNGIIYFEKPALFFWLTAFSYKLFGIGIWPARAVNALLATICCLLTYASARTLYDRLTGLLSALILSTSLLYFVMAHMVSLDMPVTVFLTATLYAFLLGTLQTNSKSQRYYFYSAAIFAGLAVLTKGLIGIVFPGLIIGAYVLVTKQWRKISTWYLPSSFLIFLLVAAPWHILVQNQHTAFFHFYFIEQHFLRYTNLEVGHYEPFWFFIPYLGLGLLPWIFFLPQTIMQAITNIRTKQDKTTWFFLLWATLIFLFFTFSKSKLIPYILPLFPALAILIGKYIATRFYPNSQRLRQNKVICLLLCITWLALVTLMGFSAKLDTRTIQPLTNILRPLLKTDDVVITYNQYYQDLPFYLERKVSILNWKNELTFGMSLQDTTAWMINDARFWQLWQGKQRLFIIISRDEWLNLKQKNPRHHFHIISETATTLLISNQL